MCVCVCDIHIGLSSEPGGPGGRVLKVRGVLLTIKKFEIREMTEGQESALLACVWTHTAASAPSLTLINSS